MKGSIAVPGDGPFRHRFGGTSWRLLAPRSSSPAPALVLVLDPRDPVLVLPTEVAEIPLCSRIDGEGLGRQTYVFDEVTKTVTFEGAAWSSALAPDEVLPTPFPETPLRLRPIAPSEDEQQTSRYDVLDTFFGGDAFMRVRGEPLWTSEPEQVTCTCGSEMEFLVCVGYETYDKPSGLVSPSDAFFLGELALYFFACLPCRRCEVVTQAL